MKFNIFKTLTNEEIIGIIKNGIIVKQNDICHFENDFTELKATDMILSIYINPKNYLVYTDIKDFKFISDFKFEMDEELKIEMEEDIKEYGLGRLLSFGFRHLKLVDKTSGGMG
jgi:hypothetical protein